MEKRTDSPLPQIGDEKTASMNPERHSQGRKTGLAIDGSASMRSSYGFAGGLLGLFSQKRSGVNRVATPAKDLSAYLAHRDCDDKTLVMYWATGSRSHSYEIIGELDAAEAQSHPFSGPKEFGGGQTALLPPLRYYLDHFITARSIMCIFITDGLIDDLPAVKQFCLQASHDIEAGRRPPAQLMMIGVGKYVDERQMLALDGLGSSAGAPLWQHKTVKDMSELSSLLASWNTATASASTAMPQFLTTAAEEPAAPAPSTESKIAEIDDTAGVEPGITPAPDASPVAEAPADQSGLDADKGVLAAGLVAATVAGVAIVAETKNEEVTAADTTVAETASEPVEAAPAAIETSEPPAALAEAIEPTAIVAETVAPTDVMTETIESTTAVTETVEPTPVLTESTELPAAVEETVEPPAAIAETVEPAVVAESVEPTAAITEISETTIVATEIVETPAVAAETVEPVATTKVDEALVPAPVEEPVATIKAVEPVATTEAGEAIVAAPVEEPVATVEAVAEAIAPVAEEPATVVEEPAPVMEAVAEAVETVAAVAPAAESRVETVIDAVATTEPAVEVTTVATEVIEPPVAEAETTVIAVADKPAEIAPEAAETPAAPVEPTTNVVAEPEVEQVVDTVTEEVPLPAVEPVVEPAVEPVVQPVASEAVVEATASAPAAMVESATPVVDDVVSAVPMPLEVVAPAFVADMPSAAATVAEVEVPRLTQLRDSLFPEMKPQAQTSENPIEAIVQDVENLLAPKRKRRKTK